MPYEVTFRIVIPKAPDAAEVVRHLAGILREALGLVDGAPEWEPVAAKLRAGVPVRVRISAEQFCRFFLRRRAAASAAGDELLSDGESTYRLKWEDAVEVADA